jgi:metal-dependent amidase/aminoacylase/carboxypeptidase family protein
VVMTGTVRTLAESARDLAETRVEEIARATAEAYGARAEVDYRRVCPVTVNSVAETEIAARAAETVAGQVNRHRRPSMGSEDFSFMLQARPGAFVFLGNGASAGLHHPAYDFNDEAIPAGCSFFVTLIEQRLPLAA